MDINEFVKLKGKPLKEKWFDDAVKRTLDVRRDYGARQDVGSEAYIDEVKEIYLDCLDRLFKELFGEVQKELEGRGHLVSQVPKALKAIFNKLAREYLDEFEILVSDLSTGDYEHISRYSWLVTDVRNEFQATLDQILENITKSKYNEIFSRIDFTNFSLRPLIYTLLFIGFLYFSEYFGFKFFAYRPYPALTAKLREADRLFAYDKPKEAQKIYEELDVQISPHKSLKTFIYYKEQQGNTYLRDMARIEPIRGRMTSGEREYLLEKRKQKKKLNLERAIKAYNQALVHLPPIEDRSRYVIIQSQVGRAHLNLPVFNFQEGSIKKTIADAIETGNLDEIKFHELYGISRREREKALEELFKGQEAFLRGLREANEKDMPLEYGVLQANSGKLYFYLWVITGQREYLEDAHTAFNAALTIFAEKGAEEQLAKVYMSLGAYYFNRSNFGIDKELLGKSDHYFKQGLKVLKAVTNPSLYEEIIKMYALQKLQTGTFNIIGETTLTGKERVKKINLLIKESEKQLESSRLDKSELTTRKAIHPDFDAIEIPSL